MQLFKEKYNKLLKYIQLYKKKKTNKLAIKKSLIYY